MRDPARQQQEILDLERRHRAERAVRFGRMRRWLRPLPRRSNLASYPVVKWFADTARKRPYLWSFKNPGLRRAVYTGAVIAFLPVYGLQLLVAFWAAVLLRANLAVTCGIQLITNPFTAGPVYYLCYRIGMWIIHTFEIGVGRGATGTRFNALVLGGVVVGLAVGFLLDLLFRFAGWEAQRLRERHRAARQAADGVGEESAPAAPSAAEPGDA